jgi:hypothetical protein
MARDVAVLQHQRKRFRGVLYVIAAGLFIWNVWQLHQLSQGYRQFMHTLATEYLVALPKISAVSTTPPANICLPLLPVSLWNRSPEDVPIPPRWHRKVV